MTCANPMPPALRRWVAEYMPVIDNATDTSWPRDASQVWRVTTGTKSAFVKVSPRPAGLRPRDRRYAYAARALAPHEAPRLLATDAGLRAILTSPLPGDIVRGLSLEPGEERHVHERAGRLLRLWHDHSAPPSDADREAIHASMVDQANEAASCLQSAAGHLDAAQRALVACVAQELPQLAEEVPLVYRHGDFSTRNWLWSPDHGCGVIDFAMAHNGLAVEELIWLCAAVWSPRPDLKHAFLSGYGRALSDTEERLLRLLATRLAVSYLNTGLTEQNQVLVERGQLALTRMTHGYR